MHFAFKATRGGGADSTINGSSRPGSSASLATSPPGPATDLSRASSRTSTDGNSADAQLQWFFSQFETFCDLAADPRMPQTSLLKNKNRIIDQVFGEFDRCSDASVQLEVLEILASLIERKPKLLLGVDNLPRLLIRSINTIETHTRTGRLPVDQAAAIQTKLCWLLGSSGKRLVTITARDMKDLYAILHGVTQRTMSSFLCPLVLTALTELLHASVNSITTPLAWFDFSGVESALVIPRLPQGIISSALNSMLEGSYCAL
jgi:hypothetical protein